MDIGRLFASICCCDEEEGGHADHSMPHHDMEMDHDMSMHDPVGEPMPCSHEGEDESSDVLVHESALIDTCCLSTMHVDSSPDWVRVVDQSLEIAYVVPGVLLLQRAKPPPLGHLTPTLSQPRLSWPPGYILFGAFLN